MQKEEENNFSSIKPSEEITDPLTMIKPSEDKFIEVQIIFDPIDDSIPFLSFEKQWCVDKETGIVHIKINNETLTLSPKEFELLVYLSDNMGIAF